jgi:hypothetical protein
MESITQFITQKLKLKLKVNEAKSTVARPQERKFLGFSFTAGPEVKRVIAPKALDRFKRRIREIPRGDKGVSLETTMEELAPYMRGWRSYFGFCETPEVRGGADWLDPLGPVAAQGGHRAAVENSTSSPGGSAGTGGARVAGEQYCWQRSRPLVPRKGEGRVRGASECILQIARTSVIVRGVLA